MQASLMSNCNEIIVTLAGPQPRETGECSPQLLDNINFLLKLKLLQTSLVFSCIREANRKPTQGKYVYTCGWFSTYRETKWLIYTSKMYEEQSWKSDILHKDTGQLHASLLKMSPFHRCFLRIFPVFSMAETLDGNGWKILK